MSTSGRKHVKPRKLERPEEKKRRAKERKTTKRTIIFRTLHERKAIGAARLHRETHATILQNLITPSNWNSRRWALLSTEKQEQNARNLRIRSTTTRLRFGVLSQRGKERGKKQNTEPIRSIPTNETKQKRKEKESNAEDENEAFNAMHGMRSLPLCHRNTMVKKKKKRIFFPLHRHRSSRAPQFLFSNESYICQRTYLEWLHRHAR